MNHTDHSRSHRIQRFVDHIPRMLAACAYTHHTRAQTVDSLLDTLEAQVELCDESGRVSVAHCECHYSYWGKSGAYWGKDKLCTARSAFRDALKRDFDHHVLEVYETFCHARFGAWRYVPGGEQTPAQAEALDGQSEPLRVELVHATTTDVSPLRHDACVAGWLVEVEGLNMLLLTCELEDRAFQKLAVAASRGAWGDADHFRACDYESDILALLLEPMSVDMGGRGVCISAPSATSTASDARGGRIFLSPVIKGWGWGLASMDLPAALQTRLAEQGLEHRGESMPWHLAVAQAENAADLAELMAQLNRARRLSITARLEPRHPIGEHTLEALVSSAELMETVCMTSAGVLDEREAYLELSLGQLGFECDELSQCGVDSDSTLEQTLRHTAMLSPGALEALGDAIYLARIRVRWTTILRCWTRAGSPWRRSPSLPELLVGIDHLFRGELWSIPIDQLPDPGRGTWPRIATAIHNAGFTGMEVRVGDLFEFVGLLDALGIDDIDGVGPKTVEHAALALAQMLADWPSGPVWLQRKPDVSQAS
jgi:hypothetical protein